MNMNKIGRIGLPDVINVTVVFRIVLKERIGGTELRM